MDWIDTERVKHDGRRRAEDLYDDHYGGQDGYDPNNSRPHERMEQQFGNNW